MHRFVWDMHYPAPQALNREFPISAIAHDTPQLPLGAWAIPGKYTVKLTVDGKSYTQPLSVQMDPRVKTSEADLRKQFEMEAGIVKGMNETYETLQQVRTLRPQVTDRAGKAKGALADSLNALDKQTGELEGASQGALFGVPASGKQAENLSTLNQHFGQLLIAGKAARPVEKGAGVRPAVPECFIEEGARRGARSQQGNRGNSRWRFRPRRRTLASQPWSDHG